jgi:two-component system sensor histidine kinase/response regulator
LTANAFLEDVKKSKEAGMDEHLSKPVNIDALEQTVKRFRVIPPKINSGIARFRR